MGYRDLLAVSPATRVVFISGYPQGADIADRDFLPKPYTRARLAQELGGPRWFARCRQGRAAGCVSLCRTQRPRSGICPGRSALRWNSCGWNAENGLQSGDGMPIAF
jgi:hypothetical protein